MRAMLKVGMKNDMFLLKFLKIKLKRLVTYIGGILKYQALR